MRPNMMVGVICLISAAAFAACQPSQPLDAAATNAASKIDAPKAVAKATQPKKAVAKADVKAPASKPATDATPASMQAMESRPVAAKQQDGESVSTTVTGCLELRDDGMFQLKDTDGEHAPKARTWKSGFIKKGAAKIDVFDAGNRLKLGSHVGYRVSITGRLTDRDMRARSLQSTSEPCQ